MRNANSLPKYLWAINIYIKNSFDGMWGKWAFFFFFYFSWAHKKWWKTIFFVEGHQREVEKVSNFHVFFHLTPSEALFKEIYCKHLCVLTCPFLLWQLKKWFIVLIGSFFPSGRPSWTTKEPTIVCVCVCARRSHYLGMDWMQAAAVNLIRNLF